MTKASFLGELTAAQKEPFKHIAFSGGGAKGTVYSGVHEELVRTGVLDGIESVAGSSAGALTAAFIASGISPEGFKKAFSDANLGDLQGKGILKKDAKPLYNMIHEVINHNIANYLLSNNALENCNIRIKVLNEEIKELNNVNDAASRKKISLLQESLKKLENIIEDPEILKDLSDRASKDTGKITFKDLDLLHTIDPVKFKGLLVTTTNKKTGELKIFNAEDTPDVEIALACRASASIPVRFKSVEIEGVKYVDGGYRDNIPQNYFDKEENPVQEIASKAELQKAVSSGRTLVLAFGSAEQDSEAHIALYGSREKIINPNKIKKFFMNVVLKHAAMVGGDFKYSQEENKTYEGLRKNALNTIMLDTKNIGTLSFKKAEKNAEYLHIKGAIQTARYFENHEIGRSDSNLVHKEFILNIYEEMLGDGLGDKVKGKIFKVRDLKINHILSLCHERAWEDKNKDDVLGSFIIEAAREGTKHDRHPKNNLSIETDMMKKVIDALNNNSVPYQVKVDFCKLIKVQTDSPQNYKFTNADFTAFIQDKQMNITVAKKKPVFLLNILNKVRGRTSTDKTLDNNNLASGQTVRTR